VSEVTRRGFLATTAGAATCLGSVGRPALAADDVPSPPQVPLGKTGITVSRLAQGTGMRGYHRQSNQTRPGFEKFVALIRHAYERGLTFFDLADLYGTHVYFREALRFMKREKVTILTKLWWRYDGRKPEEVPADYQKRSAQIALDRFLEELATEYIDVVLLHCMATLKWDQELRAYMDVLSEAKEKKKVRAVGVSCHNLGALHTAAASPWVDVIFARLNPRGVKMDGKPNEIIDVLRKAGKNGKAVVGMKIYGEGQLADATEECMRFAQNAGVLNAMTIGAETTAQLDATLKLMAKYPAKALG